MATGEVNGPNPPTPAQSVPAPGGISRKRRGALRIARIVIFIYIGLCVVFFALQNYLIFPGRASQGQKQAIIPPSTDGSYELVELKTSRGDTTHALFGRALEGNSREAPTAIFFYGNAMCLADCFGIFREMRKLGVNVLAVEYVGYGMSTGKPSETTLYETADAAWDHLQSRTDIDPKKIIAAGWSIGGAVAIDLASRKPVLGLATFSAFTSMPDMAHNLIPWLPTSLFLRHRFESARKIAEIKCPIFLAHGSHDHIIPPEMMTRLSKAATSSPRVTMISLDSDHNDVFERGDEIYQPLGDFFRSIRADAR